MSKEVQRGQAAAITEDLATKLVFLVVHSMPTGQFLAALV